MQWSVWLHYSNSSILLKEKWLKASYHKIRSVALFIASALSTNQYLEYNAGINCQPVIACDFRHWALSSLACSVCTCSGIFPGLQYQDAFH